ncbi:PREDICTED: phosphorylated adapter RNA export protein isoform X2 [Nanorana parkeri]|uniref:phosphorylated adapter RNA export protein isoform X2 n=1 Tax=Nanorana parkeri TaxID=125878 RepID=UPI0008545482|nr:PREDICTED: phosphorylated adapter RNA export protein isoform X2 [Nanorana parkeri]
MALEATRGMMEDEELEDGELSGSDTDMKVSADRAQHQKLGLPAAGGYRSNAALPLSVPYRSVKGLDSSDESFSDSDEDEGSLWKRKRQKSSHPPPEVSRPTVASAPMQCTQAARAKNNIWGAVLQEQTQEAVAAELGIMDMDGQIDMSRQSETYNYVLAKKMMTKENDEEKLKLDKELDEYMHEDKDRVPKEENGHLKRKRPLKERLGERLDMDYKGRYEITEGDPEHKVSDEIAHRLHEPKKDLIERVVKTIGTKKAIELLIETAEVEQNGGLFIMNGSRRRTPGGVYLNLLKNTPSITSDQVKEIFYMENQKEYESKKAAKKRRRHILGKKAKEAIKGLNFQEHDDTSRETFASDTNEALASLDDENSEIKADTEDAIEIDNSHDLETF